MGYGVSGLVCWGRPSSQSDRGKGSQRSSVLFSYSRAIISFQHKLTSCNEGRYSRHPCEPPRHTPGTLMLIQIRSMCNTTSLRATSIVVHVNSELLRTNLKPHGEYIACYHVQNHIAVSIRCSVRGGRLERVLGPARGL